nr:ATP-dependent Clp protease ATP-binding subunit CLPT1, chloroplastic-like [Ipomoea batatas]
MATHSLSFFSIPSPSQSCKRPQSENSPAPNLKSLPCSFLGRELSIRVPNWNVPTSKRRSCVVATVAFDLPSTDVEKAPSGKQPKWSARALKAFVMAELEARKLRYTTTGTEALLMGILVEGTSLAAKALRESGVTLFKVRDETVKLLGQSDIYIFSPEYPPLTKPARKALEWAVDEKLKSGEDGELTVSHLLLGIWAQEVSAGHIVMATLGFTDEKAKELAKTIDKDIILSFK